MLYISLFSWSFIKKYIKSFIQVCQEKPYCNKRLDTKIQAGRILLSKRKKIDEYIVDETLIKVGSELIWLWVAIEPENKQILALLQKYQKRETCLWLRRGFCQI